MNRHKINAKIDENHKKTYFLQNFIPKNTFKQKFKKNSSQETCVRFKKHHSIYNYFYIAKKI